MPLGPKDSKKPSFDIVRRGLTHWVCPFRIFSASMREKQTCFKANHASVHS